MVDFFVSTMKQTLMITGTKNSREIILNGAAASKVQAGNLIIILSSTRIDSEDYNGYIPIIVSTGDL